MGKTMQLCLAHCVGISGMLTNVTTEAKILNFVQEPDGNEEAVIGRGGEGEEVGLALVVVVGRRMVQDLDEIVRRMTVNTIYHL